MCWTSSALPIALFCLLVPALQAHRHCIEKIQWRDILLDLDDLNKNISPECMHHFDGTSFCDMKALVNTVKHDNILLPNIIKKTAWIYSRENPFKNSQKFVDGLDHALSDMRTCVHPSQTEHHDTVTTCFDKFEIFLKSKANVRCAWEVVHATTKEMLQRLERCTVRRR